MSENALSLYNAVNNSNYTNAEDLTFTTLEDVVYMKMKNDVSFVFGRTLNLYEHQSTYNPNMLRRGFLYFADLYRKYVNRDVRKDVCSQSRLYGGIFRKDTIKQKYGISYAALVTKAVFALVYKKYYLFRQVKISPNGSRF